MTRRELAAFDVIVGPVVLTGPTNSEGEETSITAQALHSALLANEPSTTRFRGG